MLVAILMIGVIAIAIKTHEPSAPHDLDAQINEINNAGREARARVAAAQEKKARGEAVAPAEGRRTGGGGRLIVLPIVALALVAALARYFALR